jgi:hypothetical protein
VFGVCADAYFVGSEGGGGAFGGAAVDLTEILGEGVGADIDGGVVPRHDGFLGVETGEEVAVVVGRQLVCDLNGRLLLGRTALRPVDALRGNLCPVCSMLTVVEVVDFSDCKGDQDQTNQEAP